MLLNEVRKRFHTLRGLDCRARKDVEGLRSQTRRVFGARFTGVNRNRSWVSFWRLLCAREGELSIFFFFCFHIQGLG